MSQITPGGIGAGVFSRGTELKQIRFFNAHALEPGQHTVTVLARDAMAKMKQASTNFWVVSCSTEIIPPSNRLALSGCACSLSDDAIGVFDGLISVSL